MNKTKQKYFEKIQASRNEDLKVFSKPENRGFLTSVIDKYTESAHFIYELLQNADDACATKAEFRLSHEGLTFVHNGKERFTISDPDKIVEDQEHGTLGHLNAITYTGFSTKDKEGTTNKIGKFGVGFKAVFQYTNTPHIYDDGICFKIEHFFVPYLIDDVQGRKKSETWIFLPFNKVGKDKDEAYQEISQRLRQLDNPLLFLHNLKEVKWKDNESQGKYSQKTKEKNNFFGVKCEHLLLENSSENKRDRLWMFSEEIEIDERRLPLYVGFYIKNGKIDTGNRSNLYCFFPTKKQLDVCFIMHAPFVLTDSREGVREVPENTYLFSKLSVLAAKSLICLRDIGLSEGHKPLIDDALSKIIITNEPDTKDPLRFFYNEFLQILQKHNLFPSRQKGIYLSASKACICTQLELRKLLSQDQLATLTEKAADFVFGNIRIDPDDIPYYEKMGVCILTSDKFGERINFTFLQNQPLDWLKLFYKYLLEHAKPLWKKQEKRYGISMQPVLTNKPIILLEDGRFTSILWEDIYISNKGLPNTLQVNQELAQDEDVRVFFKEFGIKEAPEWMVYLRNAILPSYEQVNDPINDKDFICKSTELIATTYKFDDINKEEILDLVKSNWKAVGYNCFGEKKICSVCELYADDAGLKQYFGNNPKVMYFDRDYYEISNDSEKAFSNLVSDLNFCRKPRIVSELKGEFPKRFYIYPYSKEWESKLIHPYKEIFDNAANTLRQKYDYCQEVYASFYDFKMQGLETAISTIHSIENSIQIWNYIVDVIIEDPSPNPFEILSKIEYKPPRNHHSSFFYPEQKPSLLLKILLESAWIYNNDGQLCHPSDLYIEDIDYRYNHIDKLSGLLRIVHSPKVEDDKHIELCSDKTKREVEFARQMISLGLGDCDPKYLAELVRKDEETKRLEEAARQKKMKSVSPKVPNVFQREPQKEYTAEELFDEKPNAIVHKTIARKTSTDIIEQMEQIQQEELEEAEHKNELKATAEDSERYSFLWYKTLLELEFLNSGEASYGKKGVKISFRKMEAEQGSNRMIILKQPSKHIPQALEDCGDITVNFHFNNIDRKCLTFEVANVKDYTLRLKCKNESMDEVAFLLNNSKHLVRADIDTGFPIQLIDKLLKAYEDLPYDDAYSFKGNINRDLHFVFGPPGTGKTTYLAKELKKLMSKDFLNPTTRMSKILVLCPTNKACDVLLRKVEDVCTVEGMNNFCRFKATGEEKLEQYLCDSTLPILDLEKVCVVSTMARFHYDGFDDADLKDVDWDFVVIDEASMIPLAYVTYVIDRCPHAKIIIAGDPFQIEPIVHEELWKDENIYTMVGLNDFANPKTEPYQFKITNLTTQYRSVPAIGELFSHYAYNGALIHNRTKKSQRKLHLDGLSIKPINFVTFPVKKFETLYQSHRLSTSNVHIYSVLLVYEFMNYLSEQISKNHKDEFYKIGVICPYRAQAEMINKIWEQRTGIVENVEMSIGTVHGFQGDECDVIIAVYNPPASGMKMMADKTFMNRKNILNVAVSRAKDYLFLLMPYKEYESFHNLIEIQTLGRIVIDQHLEKATFTDGHLEEVLFGNPYFIEENSFVTTHQLTNIYTEPSTKYEVRIDENSVDIQLGSDNPNIIIDCTN